YLAAEADSFPEHPLRLPFALAAAANLERASLIDLVDATYIGTLDCPRIDNLRKTADVIEGYQAVGASGSQLWKIVLGENDRRVGCLLIADHPSAKQWEIVYVGLVPEVRGRGWGLELTRHAQWLARQAKVERLVLAVDAANEPAIRIYAAAGFLAWDRRAIWIKPLARGETGLPPTT
ncbi:MAG TPA: GNAT family N-acetyltransferase, partial [Pirellulaceae bacterium]|nr:GNAT family N-acetyltransferase [Pirellulaceae bacterium]